MVYRRKGRKGYTFQARTQTGWEQMGTGAANKALAQRIETMWETLASTHRAWDILQPILDGGRSRSKLLGTLYDLWLDTKYDISEIRRRLNDANVEPYVDEYMNIFRQQGGLETTAAYNTAYLRYLLPEGAPVLVSECSEEWLTEQLYAYRDAKGNAVKGTTLRKVHSAWSGFFDYLVRPKRLLTSNPLAHVPRPEVAKLPIRFYELKEVEKIIFAQPTLERRALFSLAYGTGLEPIVIVGRKTQPIVTALTRSDFDEQSHEVRAAGTKTHTRDRMALVADCMANSAGIPQDDATQRTSFSARPIYNHPLASVYGKIAQAARISTLLRTSPLGCEAAKGRRSDRSCPTPTGARHSQRDIRHIRAVYTRWSRSKEVGARSDQVRQASRSEVGEP